MKLLALFSLLFGIFALQAQTTLPELLEQAASARAEERFSDALRHLQTAEQAYPKLYELNNLIYLESVTRRQAGQLDQAAEGFQSLLNTDFPLQDSVLLHLIETRHPPPATGHLFEEFLTEHEKHRQWGSVALQYARLLEEQNLTNEALTWYDRIIDRAGPQARPARLNRALLLLKPSGHKPPASGITSQSSGLAQAELSLLMAANENDDIAYRAARELHKLQPLERLGETDTRRRARVFLNNRQTDTARPYLQKLLRDFPKSPSADEDAYLLARSYSFDGDFKKTIDAYNESYRRYPATYWGLFSKYLTGNMYLRLDDYQEAIEAYRYIIDRHPKSELVDNAYYNLGDAYRWLGQTQAAQEAARRALSVLAPSEKDRFRYFLAVLHLESDEWTSALQYLQALDHLSSVQLPSGVTQEEIYYWKGYALEHLGRKDEAFAAYEEAFTGSPNYFAYISRDRASSIREIRVIRWPSPTQSWRQSLPQPRPLFWSPEQKSAHGTDRLSELLFLRLYDEAYWELRHGQRSAASGQLYALAYLADLGHLPAESLAAAERLRQSAFPRVMPESYPEALRSLLYPRHYWSLVQRFGDRFNVDPEFILALIQQESRFQKDSKSPASARGLMQFMSGTANRLASELRLGEIDEYDLYRPEVSIQLGAYYVSKLVRQFDGSLEKALASYNGGADNVQRWSRKTPRQEAPFFVANIGFRETKLYVLRVMGNYHAYKSIYALRAAP